jgi:chromosome partitioning protein
MKQSHHQSLPLIYLDPKHKLTQQYAALYQEIESR